MAVGTKDLIGFAIESSFGTAPAAPTKAWPFRGDRPVPRVEFVNDEDTKVGSQILGSESVPVRRWVEASGLEMDARLDNLAFWLYVTLGKVTTSGSSPNYTHVIENNGAEKPSLTAYYQDALLSAGKLRAYQGLKVQNLTIRSQEGGQVVVVPDLVGKGSEDANGYSEVTAAMAGLTRGNILTHAKISEFKLGGVDFKSVIRSFELSLAPQYDIQGERGAGLYLPQMECQGMQITLNSEFNHNTGLESLIANVLSQTSVAASIVITDGTQSATIALPAVFLDDAAVTGGKGKLRKSFQGRAYEDIATAEAIKATVINSTASYTS